MATWRQYNKLENAQSAATAEAAEFVSILVEMTTGGQPSAEALAAASERVRIAARALNDAMRSARQLAQAAVVAERGWPK